MKEDPGKKKGKKCSEIKEENQKNTVSQKPTLENSDKKDLANNVQCFNEFQENDSKGVIGINGKLLIFKKAVIEEETKHSNTLMSMLGSDTEKRALTGNQRA